MTGNAIVEWSLENPLATPCYRAMNTLPIRTARIWVLMPIVSGFVAAVAIRLSMHSIANAFPFHSTT